MRTPTEDIGDKLTAICVLLGMIALLILFK
jgi:hypothetical protein